MSAQTNFTPGRENDIEAGPYSTNGFKRYKVIEARQHDRCSLLARSLPVYRTGLDFERYGRFYVRLLAADHIIGQTAGIKRGGALTAEPNTELRQKIQLYKKVQAAREQAFEALQGEDDLERLGKDVPARLGLGGLQDFTAGRENTHKRPKGYAPWRPHKKTVALMFQVKQILEEYRDHLPLTARQIFYRLVAAYGYPKTENAYGNLTEHLVRARRAKQIPFEYIRDDGISVMAPDHYADEDAFWRAARERAESFTRDKLARQKMNIRVYCEAAGMMPQLERVCEPYSIPVYSCSGFDSLSAKYQLKEACWRAYTYQGRRTVILHLGDHDPSGDSIFNDGLVEDIHAFLAEDVPGTEPHEVATFERVALKTEHIERFNLPTEPPKKTDSRTKNWEGGEACQLEALPPDVLAGLLDATIKTYINLAYYAQDLEADEPTRRRLTRALPAPSGE